MTRIELSVGTLYRLLQKEELGQPHPVLAGGERYYSPRFHQESDATLRRELDAAGVNSAHGVHEGFLDLLRVTQRATVEYFGWLTDADGPYAVLVAGLGRSAVLVQRAGERVAFERTDPDRVVAAMVAHLPDVSAGRGDSITVPAADYGRTPGQDGFSMNRSPGTQPVEARRMAMLMAAPRVGGGKLYAARRDQRGTRQRSASWLDLVDVAGQGRWVVYATQNRGERSINAVPGTPHLIGAKLAWLRQTIG